jgi:hypothetical protein
MTPEERFERIEQHLEQAARTMAQTVAINAETAQIMKKVSKNLYEYISESREGRKNLEANLNAYITESREGRKNLQATLDALLKAMLGRQNGKA